MSAAPRDRMAEIEAQVAREFKVFDAKRKKLATAYYCAEGPKARLRVLAKLMRQHGEYMDSNVLIGGWQTRAISQFAEQVEMIADMLK